MNCDESRRHWELYYDSEGDSELYLKINEHLAECPSCAKWFFQQGQVEELITSKLTAGEPTADLWHRVLSETGLARPVTARGWMFFSPLMAIAASLLLVVGGWWVTSDREPEHLAALTAVVHRGFAEQNKPIDFNSPSDQEVEQYLKTRVSFPVRCPPRKDAGFAVRGGGVCTLGGDLAAYVVGIVDGREVSIFILPEERLAHFGHERNVLGREAVHHCREGAYEMVMAKIDRNIVVVIGEGSPEQLERVVQAYGTYPETPTADAA
jgi:anti-sigma factor RsiW